MNWRNFYLSGFLVAGLLTGWTVAALLPQTTVNGVVPGKLWRTDNVSGEVEVFHIWGRRTTMPVKSAWVNIDGDTISIGAKCDDPVLDGKPRTGYQMVYVGGPVQTDFPAEHVQTITEASQSGLAEDGMNITEVRHAAVQMSSGVPKSLIFVHTEQADFNIAEARAKLPPREAEHLDGFDDQGFRIRVFKARFE